MADAVLTSENRSNHSPLDPPSRFICHVCQKQFSHYTCPRCNSRYCSLPCYKSHSERCTESFMRENVMEEMKGMAADEETKRKMLDILKRFHSEEQEGMDDRMDDDDLGDDSVLSEETVQKVLSGGPINFDDLSGRREETFPKSCGIWRTQQPLTEEEASSSHQDYGAGYQPSEIPPGPDTLLPPVRKLISREPSPFLAYHLVDIIYSYCFTQRLYNGDWQSDAIGSATVVLSVSSVLGQTGQPETVLEALSYCLERTCSPEYRHMGGLQFGLGLVNDVIHVMSLGGHALICLLCDLQKMVQAGEKELKAEKTRKSKSDIRSKLKLAERKVYFIMCWVHEQPGEAWSSLAAIVRAEKSSGMDYRVGKNVPAAKNKTESRGKVLIEEL
ncbi:ZINC FINGER HIT DOMAIN CONTAINING PROTEIN 2 PROTEIN FON -RELATED [Salix koriyanagi]|uniref:ZINC FINGER HIT DOMAIN CONTAINING PROTEIN 2 PROTEIN FON -RELATED n=1 Tax=Salix koriyanagi TaxID=2511006 RepID=A0A9Q0Q8B0_9ROSI|nr:ZINC FINGER HIT DOMAIN CONTAINING PROTEIN 2 PROTEIN FON -RELATED [Salix koriyanagi]